MARNSASGNSGGRRSPTGRVPEQPRKKSFLRRMVTGLFVWGFAFALLGAIFLGTAVAFTAHELPDYSSLKSSQNGQMIVVRARDGTELVSLGPSYGKWLPYSQIPAIMRDAMVTVEDKRFRDHYGVDPIGIARSVKVRIDTGQFRQGGSTITQQLARNVFLNNTRTFGRKIREMVLAFFRAGEQVQQGPDPRTLSQQGLLRRRCLWHRCGEPQVLRSPGDRAFDSRSGDHCGPCQSTVQLLSDSRRQGGHRARHGRAGGDGQERCDYPGRGRCGRFLHCEDRA